MGMKTYEEAEDIGETTAKAIEVPVDAPRVPAIPSTEPSDEPPADDMTTFKAVMTELERIGWTATQAEALAAAEGVVDDEERKLPTYEDKELMGLLEVLKER